ncbi:hypothetical protein EDC04DRAFT_2607728 [Pisolithus marmoratus]|nr:hypothetical protein EDC04DRAFT_2607728 [Pisolithus marmoratus]
MTVEVARGSIRHEVGALLLLLLIERKALGKTNAGFKYAFSYTACAGNGFSTCQVEVLNTPTQLWLYFGRSAVILDRQITPGGRDGEHILNRAKNVQLAASFVPQRPGDGSGNARAGSQMSEANITISGLSSQSEGFIRRHRRPTGNRADLAESGDVILGRP